MVMYCHLLFVICCCCVDDTYYTFDSKMEQNDHQTNNAEVTENKIQLPTHIWNNMNEFHDTILDSIPKLSVHRKKWDKKLKEFYWNNFTNSIDSSRTSKRTDGASQSQSASKKIKSDEISKEDIKNPTKLLAYLKSRISPGKPELVQELDLQTTIVNEEVAKQITSSFKKDSIFDIRTSNHRAFFVGKTFKFIKATFYADKMKDFMEFIESTETDIKSESYIYFLMDYFTFCTKFSTFKYVSKSLNWIKDNFKHIKDAIKDITLDYPEEKRFWCDRMGPPPQQQQQEAMETANSS